MYRILTSIMLLILSQTIFALPSQVKLSTKIWPPYHYYDQNNKMTGTSVKVLECSFTQLNIHLIIETVPWRRAQQHTRLGISDGFFSASWNASRDEYATRSVDIAPQKWVWYTLKSNDINPSTPTFKQKAKVVGTRGSNIIHWLRKNDYMISAETTDLDNMVNMVLTGRVDAFMENELVAQRSLEGTDELKKLNKSIARSMPVGVYFNHKFLSQYPDFLTAFNQAVIGCY